MTCLRRLERWLEDELRLARKVAWYGDDTLEQHWRAQLRRLPWKDERFSPSGETRLAFAAVEETIRTALAAPPGWRSWPVPSRPELVIHDVRRELLLPDHLANGGRRKRWRRRKARLTFPNGQVWETPDDGDDDLEKSYVSGFAREPRLGSGRTHEGALDYRAHIDVDFMASGTGFKVEERGSTGLPAHRPAAGVRVRYLIEKRIVEAMNELEIATPLETMTASIRRGRLSGSQQTAHDDLARLVYILLTPPRPVNASEFAAYLGCGRTTIYRLRDEGAQLMEQKSVRGEALIFLPEPFLRTERKEAHAPDQSRAKRGDLGCDPL